MIWNFFTYPFKNDQKCFRLLLFLKKKKKQKKKKSDRRKATIRFSRHERIDATLLSRLPRILRQEPGLETTLIFVVNSYQVEWRRQYTRTHRTMPHICDPWWSHPSWNLLRHVFPRGWMPFREDVWRWGCSKPILNSWFRRLSLESIWMRVSFLGCDLIVKLWIKGDKGIFIPLLLLWGVLEFVDWIVKRKNEKLISWGILLFKFKKFIKIMLYCIISILL